MIRKRRLLIALMCCLTLLCSINLLGQVTASASLQGTIVDPSQTILGNRAEVTIINRETGAIRTVHTNDAGEYHFELLPAGTYTIKVNAPGFAGAVARNVEVLLGRTTKQNFTLQLGPVSETVEVITTAPLLDQNKTDVSSSVTQEQITELPLIGRDIADLAYLSPGIKAADSYDPTKNRYSILSVNGQGGRNINVTVNGIDNKDNTVGGPVMQLPAEAVQEFQVSTQRFSAVNGRSEGAAINVITKSGSNHVHGSAFGFFRNEALNAAQKLPDPQNNSFVYQNPPYSRQWFGGSVGAPIKKDKVFVFFAMERQREQTSIAESPAALEQLNLVTSLGAKPAAIIPTPFYENRLAGRMDWTINSKHSAYLSVSTQANNSLNDQSGGFFDLTEGNFTVNHMQIANVTLNSAFSSTLINQFTVGGQYWNNLIDSATRAPLVSFPLGSRSIQFGTNADVPQYNTQRKWQFKDDITKIAGRHAFKTGVDYIWTPIMGGFLANNSTLEINFGVQPSCILGVGPDAANPSCGLAIYPQGFSTPGLISSGNNGSGMTINVGDPAFLIKDAKQIGVYFQDDWKVSRRLLLNLGIRWDKDFDFVGRSAIRRSRTFEELEAAAPFSPLAASLVRRTAGDYNKNFSPRIGLAYDLTGNGAHMVHAGFGMYSGNTFQNIPLFMEQQSNATIFQAAFNITGSDIVPGTGIPLSSWRFGVDPMPVIPPPSHNLSPGSTGRIIDPNYRNPITEEFNGGYAWSINPKSVVEVEYVHVLSLHENKTINLDPNLPVTPNNITNLTRTGLPGGFFRPLDSAFAAANVPVLGSVRDETSGGRGRYDGMNITYRQRGFHKTDIIANYTLARAVGYNEEGFVYHYYPRDPQHPLSPFEFGPSFNDERHHITLAVISNLPWGLEFAPILQAGSARPYNVTSSFNELNIGSGASPGGLIVPNSDPTNVQAMSQTDTASRLAAVNCYYSGNCHVVPFNSMRGDPFFNVDARLAKNIRLGENRKLQLAFQAFNLFNHANYGNNFDNVVQDSTFARPLGFINPTSSVLPRAFTAEFGARFSF